jgi:hypothetical protein
LNKNGTIRGNTAEIFNVIDTTAPYIRAKTTKYAHSGFKLNGLVESYKSQCSSEGVLYAILVRHLSLRHYPD